MKHIFISVLSIFLMIFQSGDSLAEIKADIEIYAELPKETPPGNIAIGPDGRIFLSIHGFFGQDVKVVELFEDGTTKPYPNEGWAYAPEGTNDNGIYDVLGLNVDQKGVLWMLDTSGQDRAGRLIGWDTNNEKLHKIIYLAKPVINDGAFLNDLAIDRENEFIYIADTASKGSSALITVDLKTGLAKRHLEGSQYTEAEDINMVIDDKVVSLGGNPARIGVNPITISPDNQWLYFAAMSSTSLYRIETRYLREAHEGKTDPADHVVRYGDKPISDGITVDGGGNVYITSITDDSVGVVQSDGSYKTLFKRDDMSWPDGFAYGADNQIYVTINELHRSTVLNAGVNASNGEFKVMRFDPLVPGEQGR